MVRFFAIAALSAMMMGYGLAEEPPQAAGVAEPGPADALPSLPRAPGGKPTLLGGEIEKIDPVRDQFTLGVPGGRPIKLLFDARTQVYRDGVKIAAGELHKGDRASVETVLDGDRVFAVSIHMLSRPPEGECEGEVTRYDPRSRVLTVNSALSREPIQFIVPVGTSMSGQKRLKAPADSQELMAGTLVSVRFYSDHNGRGVAEQIAVVATPGSVFEFDGNITSLDLHAGLLVVADAEADHTYQLAFDPGQFALSRDLHVGEPVKVKAKFDGGRYVATAIAVD